MSVYNAQTNQLPRLKAFLNNTTTVTYGDALVWDTTTLYDNNGDDIPFQFGVGATQATTTAEQAIPAGLVWGSTLSVYTTATVVSADAQGFLVIAGLHPHGKVFGTVSIADSLFTNYAKPGALKIDNTAYATISPMARCLEASNSTVTQNVLCWVNLGGMW